MKLSERIDELYGAHGMTGEAWHGLKKKAVQLEAEIAEADEADMEVRKEVAQLEARLASARAIMQRFVNKVDDIDKDEMIDVENICVEMKEWLDD